MGELAEQKQTNCPKCGEEMAEHIDRFYCARCDHRVLKNERAPVPRFKTESDADYVQRLREGNIG